MVEPAFQDVRQGVGRSVTLRCTMLKGSPMKVATSIWRFNGTLLAQPLAEQQDYSELKVDSVSRETSGSYECSISNDVGVSTCLFQVSGKSQCTSERAVGWGHGHGKLAPHNLVLVQATSTASSMRGAVFGRDDFP